MFKKLMLSLLVSGLSASVYGGPNCPIWKQNWHYENREVEVCEDIIETTTYEYKSCDYNGWLQLGHLWHTPAYSVPFQEFSTANRIEFSNSCPQGLFESTSSTYWYYDDYGVLRTDSAPYSGWLSLYNQTTRTGTTETVVGQQCHTETRRVRVYDGCGEIP